ncbi:beta-ketoacyl-[acyl-carrier-protein] synthase family protein [Thalassospira mesophila]|uniref:beta-ketoacyl-[acyl-carrier-protein] synthase family protein n=1 Tax=Thalassospira mesophila TaxID=1293891 RepID=UPI000A1DF836|nr:beta-ketoacyl-[acyl-carrier-protein] synthase family protein [Thalassospira mesophila]
MTARRFSGDSATPENTGTKPGNAGGQSTRQHHPVSFLHALGIVSALGMNGEETRDTLFGDRRANMVTSNNFLPDRTVTVGMVPSEPPALPENLRHHDTRNNRLLWAATCQISDCIAATIARYGAGRIGIILGTSTSGIDEGTQSYRHYLQQGTLPENFSYAGQEIGAPADFLREALGLGGPAYVISTACSSSAKVFSAGQRLIRAGICDAVLIGGVDSLCSLTIAGFAALQSVASGLCNPMSINRDGINIGEGAAVFMMRRDQADIALLGVGETSDAHHPNAPHPDGIGARAAMQQALDQAGLMPSDIAYLNMHGTATPLNDSMEAKAIHDLFGDNVPVSSTKPMTGHTLGAAGAIEAAILYLSLDDAQNNGPRLPRHIWDGGRDDSLPDINLVTDHNNHLAPTAKCAMLSNSFAFGGSNAAVILATGWHHATDPEPYNKTGT